ncbi:carboxyvinyl-carboxyphosphonate phosphorylmutase [Microbispora rosea subsp. aerata]|nr:isocitrate lyase/phosphoenolpyruvate mutase family protein [Microbispora rosea]GGO29694.1 carboxyvinyl-carboxyphosphonate phosphorylmutase [Microbispora rosea subsp. aerata]GIH58943.1 carboxyvinyl-carboxyphosphonate phosphorylmutase [Microbispora rosea subsp. aerata]GLJ86189.1 carboxyvinyl-carboxyphosphonate phosphorylmutase [Microbispora rosea subsp. aerata]
MPEISEKAAALRALHVPGDPVVLPNAWDAASARAVEAAGFPAVATGSESVAAALGYEDGHDTPVDEMFAAVARITRVVTVPVTADVERGYGLEPAELVERIAAAGAVGCNLEDSDPPTGAMIDAAEQADFLAAVRAAADEAGTGLVINARVDTFMHGSGTPEERLAEAIDRGRRYLAAGADCVYPILASDPEVIGALAREIGGPINVFFRPGMPSIRDLAALGVARVSFGPGIHRAAQAFTARMLDAITRGDDPFPPA